MLFGCDNWLREIYFHQYDSELTEVTQKESVPFPRALLVESKDQYAWSRFETTRLMVNLAEKILQLYVLCTTGKRTR